MGLVLLRRVVKRLQLAAIVCPVALLEKKEKHVFALCNHVRRRTINSN